MNKVAVIILAAGKGSRMKSDLAKVLHRVAGKSMINHVIEAATEVASNHIHVVVGHQADKVRKEIPKKYNVQFAFQKELLGTGDAVRVALPGVDACIQHVLVLCGDVPLIRKQTIADLVSAHRNLTSGLTVLAAKVSDPTGYGRIIKDNDGQLLAIREEADATDLEKQIDIVNSGIFCFEKQFLESGLGRIQNNNSQGEYYLTDLVAVAVQDRVKTLVKIIDDAEQVMGVNTIEQLTRINTAFHMVLNELS
ncbi:nucleoside-diphosphate-sugar pyrophosphorylase [Desulfobacter hydrogenophilus]|uniref:Nucleoside-diphosphate-sugar pyrophosphorylase n=1 Tax=Desulfobacter hydrogenophilus TaxID=2291 RepID=A0A328FHG6_9BACT|nr:sugar phosphate nucleotidyltransferase [Desulfobacter hydrogenophilus]NDY71569.1 NTP transferase domain-containing protein [Desulfobacter hydrogenophilus]QBH15346.1 nucleoside-diphosphate-sugar pyrophosphorylase [Desulfobacter hydrogenophilus]RAM02425.1 nucleoside-diphosphate-sugar pyrophosphorylase [Desulfobacter hydrogenophilus]